MIVREPITIYGWIKDGKFLYVGQAVHWSRRKDKHERGNNRERLAGAVMVRLRACLESSSLASAQAVLYRSMERI